jgi:hypothetical protein
MELIKKAERRNRVDQAYKKFLERMGREDTKENKESKLDNEAILRANYHASPFFMFVV